MGRRKRRSDGLHSKVVDFVPHNDGEGEPDYIPYCTFRRHVGIVLDKDVCEKRQCEYYRKLYIYGVGRLD